MPPRKTKAPVGEATKGSQQTPQPNDSLLATLRKRLRDLAIVQDIALRNGDKDTFTNAHRAWMKARLALENQFPVEVRRTADMQWAGFEAGQRQAPVAPSTLLKADGGRTAEAPLRHASRFDDGTPIPGRAKDRRVV